MGLSEETNYWDNQWRERIKPDIVERNRGKFDFLINELWKRPHYATLKKLDIGCGPAEHANEMEKLYSNWIHAADSTVTRYTGLELSDYCIRIAASRFGISIEQENIYKYITHEKYELFLLLDTFEHIEFPEKLAEKIKELAAEKFYIFGNIPLYHSDPSKKGGYEKPMDVNDVCKFLKACGIDKMWYQVYGINGYPYLVWEGKK
jgi:SAM-dependent methyltransferase